MTQPMSILQTFDTGLVDMQRSFSSTETNTSGSSAKENVMPPSAAASKSASTAEFYEQWASTYDTDGNVLQIVDDMQIDALLPKFTKILEAAAKASGRSIEKILDLGCGTGRNTVKLLTMPWDPDVEITGLDASEAMLALARTKCERGTTSMDRNSHRLEQCDFSDPGNVPPEHHGQYDGLISTLVLEHFALQPFFEVVQLLLKPGGIALVTSMHPDIGATMQAGFTNANGERVKGESIVHSVVDTVSVAGMAGFELVAEVHEVMVEEYMLSRLGETGRKLVGKRAWYGLLVRKKLDNLV